MTDGARCANFLLNLVGGGEGMIKKLQAQGQNKLNIFKIE